MSDQQSNLASRCSLAAFLLLLAATASLAYAAWSQDYFVSVGLLATVIFCSVSGFRLGGLNFVVMIFGMAVAVMYSSSLGQMIEPTVTKQFGTGGLAGRMISIGIVGSAIIIISAILVRILSKRICSDRPILGVCNQWLGVTLGVCQGIGLALLVLGGLLVTEPTLKAKANDRSIQESVWRTQLVHGSLSVVEAMDGDPVGEVAYYVNPFRQVPQLKALAAGVELAGNPAALQKIAGQFKSSKLRESTAVQNAMAELTKDPQLKPFLTQGKPLDQAAMSNLMSNPAVLQLMDDPDVQAQIKQMAKQIGSGQVPSGQ